MTKGKTAKGLTNPLPYSVRFTVTAAQDDDGNIFVVTFSGETRDREDAKKFAASFPKWLLVKGCSCTSSVAPDGGFGWTIDEGSVPVEYGTVGITVYLSADGVNKGTNEGGLKRLRRFASMVEWTYLPDAFKNSAAPEAFEKLARGGC